MKKVVRKYVNKRGELVVKEYNYTKKYTNKAVKNRVLITKKGTISKRAERYLGMIEDIEEREYVKQLMKFQVWQQQQPSQSGNPKSKRKFGLSLQMAHAMYLKNKLYIFMDNMGVDIEELVERINEALLNDRGDDSVQINEAWVLQSDNWIFDSNKGKGIIHDGDAMLMLQDGSFVIFSFHYQSGFEITVQWETRR